MNRTDWGLFLLKHIIDCKPKVFGLEKPARSMDEASSKMKFVEKKFGADLQNIFALNRAMAKRNLPGAPGTREVAKQLTRWRKLLV